MTAQIDLVKLAADIGARLRAWREDQCLSQTDMAEGAGLSRPQLNRYERGEDVPQTSALIRLFLYTKRSMHWIVFGEDVEERVPVDPALRECMFDLEAASPHCRKTVIDIAYRLMTADQAEAALLSRRVGDTPPK